MSSFGGFKFLLSIFQPFRFYVALFLFLSSLTAIVEALVVIISAPLLQCFRIGK